MQKWMLAGVMMLGLSACGGALENVGNIGRPSDPSRFYVLTSEGKQADMPEIGGFAIGVGPVEVADYLDRSQMVVRDSANHLTLQEFDRWAGDVPKEVQKVLVANLITLSGGGKVLHYPWKTAMDTDYILELYVEQMDYAQGEAVLIIQWQLYEGDRQELLISRRSQWREKVEKDFGRIVQTFSQQLAEFTQEVAKSIAVR